MTVPPVIFLEDELRRLREMIAPRTEHVENKRIALSRAERAHDAAVQNLGALQIQIQRAEKAIKVLKGVA